MKKIRFFILLTLLSFVIGCEDKPKFSEEELKTLPFAKRDGLPEPTGGFAIAIGDQTVTTDDVIGPAFERLSQKAQTNDFETFRQIAEPYIERELDTRIADAILYSKAKKEAGDKIDDELDKATTAEIRRFVMDFGGDYAKADDAIKKMGMDWGKFEQYQRRKILSQSYISQLVPKDQTITYTEMRSVYEQTKNKNYTTPGTLQFRLIDLEPAKLQNIDTNLPRSVQAKDLANQISARLKQGEDFETLARKYSTDFSSQSGGLWKKIDPNSLASPYDILASKAQSMKPGEIAGPIEIQGHIFIMQLVEYQPQSVEPFESVQNQIRATINFQRISNALDKLNNELVQQASAADKERFMNFCIREIYKMANK